MPHAVSRRDFVRTSLAAAGAAAIGAALLPTAARAEEKKPKMRIGLVTYMVGAKMDLDTLIATCEQGGMQGVELRTTHAHGVEPTLSADERAKVKARFARTPVKLHMLGSICEYHSPDAATVRKNIDQTRVFVDLAADLGAWGVKVRPNGLPKEVPEEQTLKQIGLAARECGEYAKSKGVFIVMEVHGGGTAHPPRMAKIMEHCAHPSVGLCWNCNGGDIQDGSIKEYFTLCAPWIRHVHIHTLTEKGYPWEELFALLKARGFSDYTMIETTYKGDDPVGFLKAQRAEWDRLAV
jgi:sugar phosphate isomerase/epimerase